MFMFNCSPLELLLGVDAQVLELPDERVELLRRQLVQDAASLSLQGLWEK